MPRNNAWIATLPRVIGVATPSGYRWDCPHCGGYHLRMGLGPRRKLGVARCKATGRRAQRWVNVVAVIERKA